MSHDKEPVDEASFIFLGLFCSGWSGMVFYALVTPKVSFLFDNAVSSMFLGMSLFGAFASLIKFYTLASKRP